MPPVWRAWHVWQRGGFKEAIQFGTGIILHHNNCDKSAYEIETFIFTSDRIDSLNFGLELASTALDREILDVDCLQLSTWSSDCEEFGEYVLQSIAEVLDTTSLQVMPKIVNR